MIDDPRTSIRQETYLGDDVFVAYDGWRLRLRLSHAGVDHFIYLDGQVWKALTEFVDALKAVEA